MRLIAPFGFYGWGNIGDESTLQGFARLVGDSDPAIRAWIGSRNPRHTRKVEPAFGYFLANAQRSIFRRWAWLTADAAVVPGGTPIGDALGAWPLNELAPLMKRASRLGKPIAFIGTGTERLREEASKRVVATEIAPLVTCWTVRSTRDRERLIEYGVDADSITATADLAWNLSSVPTDEGRRILASLGIHDGEPLVGVNVNIEAFVRLQRPTLLADIAGALDTWAEVSGARILFLCNEVRDGETFDFAASQEVVRAMRRSDRATIVPNTYWAPQTMLSIIGCCRFTVSTRYHFCLFSAVQGVPFVAIQRSDKVRDLAHDLSWPLGLDLDDLTDGRLVEAFENADTTREALHQHLQVAHEQMRTRSRQNALALDALRREVAS